MLLITIKDWSTEYRGVHSAVVVDMVYVLKDTRTGLVLWESRQPVVYNSGGGNPIAMVVSAALNALLTDCHPLAQRTNATVFMPPNGIPAGPYHPEFQEDQGRF